jgi:hypothetical protein
MKSAFYLILVAVLLVSCSTAPSENSINTAIAQTQESQATSIPIPTNTPFPTYTAFPTYTLQPIIAVEVTRIVMVTPTYTLTPLYTPTITNTPTNTFTPTQTPNATQTAEALLFAKLRENKGDGFYLVNVDIAPGVWRSTGTGDRCYWSVTEANGDIIDNHYGMSGGTAYISPNGFQVQFEDCGTWEFLSPP